MNNILILGSGYIGTELFSWVNKEKNNYWIFPRRNLDYTDQGKLGKFILNNNINYVINCVGFTGKPNVDEGEIKREECWYLNVLLPLKISDTCKRLNVNYIHISSGCIYTGYHKEFTEKDTPNFGLYDHSSFYSKSKHAFETLNNYGCTIRIRMPFSNDHNDRNYISKIIKYDKIINLANSKTYLPNLCYFIEHIINHNLNANNIGVINFVNPQAQDTEFLVNRAKVYGLDNPNWEFVDWCDINISAPRSNCVLSMDKFNSMFPDLYIETEAEAIEIALTNIQDKKDSSRLLMSIA